MTAQLHYKVFDLTWDGRGVARSPDGRIAMIAGSLPGDVVTAAFAPGSDRGPLHGKVLEIVTPSPDRIPHPCTFHHALCITSPVGFLAV